MNAVWLHTVLRTLAKDPKYPEFGEGSERRIAHLKKLVARAEKYGIRVFLYMNEPRAMPASFFEKSAERQTMKGACEGEQYAMCTACPETLRWLRDSLEQVFAQVPGLGGIFTITMSENLTHCAARGTQKTCSRCKGRKVGDLIVETNKAMIEGMVRGNPQAEALVWNWAWPKDEAEYVVRHLPKNNIRLMAVSENGMPLCRGGVKTVENDYSISVVGPGENARRMWGFARTAGVPSVAKVQAANSWELSSFPYIPAMDLVAQHAVNLSNEGVNGVMLSWSLGCCPSPNLAVYRDLAKGEKTPDGVLDRMAEQLYGKSNVSRVRQAWKAFSDGFSNYPFSLGTIYNGPQQWGPANPLYMRKTGWSATMVGIPYDALDSWRAEFPAETYAALMGRVADGFAEGCRLLEGVAEKRELDMFRAEQMHFASCRDQARFVQARDAGDREGMKRYAAAELARAKAYWPLVRADSRIGYESSNHYFFVPRDLLEKVLSCRQAIDVAREVRAVQLDLARQKESVSFVKSYAKRVSAAGYNTLVLYLEDRVKTPSYPYCTDAESYSLDEMKDLVRHCTALGLDVVPVISPLGHTERFLRHPELARFAETREGQGRFGAAKEHNVFCLSDPEARAWMETYIGEVAAAFPGKNLHLGFDETFDLGFCSRCRPVLEKEGLAKLYLRSVLWAHGVATRLGKRMWMWDDYFDFFPEALAEVPCDILMCCWNYDTRIEKSGPRGHFGGRLRRDNLKEYERLGFGCLFCPWFEYQNVRTFTEYASQRKRTGAFYTQWEMETDFHGTFLPRTLGAGLLWSGKASLAGGAWLDAGIAMAYPTTDARLRRTIRGLVLDQLKFKFDEPSVLAALNRCPQTAKFPAWRTAVEDLRVAPSRPGTGDVPPDPLSEAALLDDLVVRTELSLLCFESLEAVRYLSDPARDPAVSREEKRRLVGMKTRWNELVARREAQWQAWRGGIVSERKDRLHASLPKLVDEMLKVPDMAPENEWIFEADVTMADTHGIPRYEVEGRFGGEWKPLVSGVWKPDGGAPAYSPKLVPVSFEGMPDALRISEKGYGSGSLCHVSLRNRSRRLVPRMLLETEGRVLEPENLLVDDLRETRFGNPDCTAAVLDSKLAEEVSSVTVSVVRE